MSCIKSWNLKLSIYSYISQTQNELNWMLNTFLMITTPKSEQKLLLLKESWNSTCLMVSLTCSSHSLLHSPSITLTILSRDTAGNSPRNSELRPSARRPGLVPMAEKKSSIRVESSRSSEVVEGDKSPSRPPRVEPSWGLLVSQGFSNCKLFLG